MKKLLTVCKLSILIFVASFVLAKLAAKISEPILFQSLESLNSDGGPVINEIQWFRTANKDIWMMNQNHDSLATDKFDRVAVVINKTKQPMTAQFMQLEPGPLVWSEDLPKKQISFSVSCFACHTNGLRVIRPNWKGILKAGLFDRAKVAFANSMISSYGRLVEHESHEATDPKLDIPFRHRSKMINEKLSLQTCTECHNGKKLGVLTRQNKNTIQFMLKQNLMPPEGRALTKQDKQKLFYFVNGF